MNNIENPIYNTSADTIGVFVYDGFNDKVIARSYTNLDPFSFIYSYLGPLITVNNNEDIIVERGT